MSTELPSQGSLDHGRAPGGQVEPIPPAPQPPAATDVPAALFEEPYAALLSKFQALRAEELTIVNLDIPSAVTTALGVAPDFAALVDRVKRECPVFDIDPVTRLDTYAMALSHAHTLYLMASAPVDALAPLVEEGTKLRETLFADASALVQRNLLNGQQLKDLQGPSGYKNLAFDLQILAALFHENMPQLQGKCATQVTEVQRANEIAASVLRTVGLREQGPASIASTSDIRTRAFTLFMRAYDQARRVVSFLRWNEDDVDTIIPSLFAGRGGRKKAVEPPPLITPPQTTPIVTPLGATTAPATGPAPTAPAPTGAAKPTSSATDPFLS